MQALPHLYTVSGRAEAASDVSLSAAGLETLLSAPPAEFGGPGDKWSPETLLLASMADCFILTFKAVARASHLEWLSLSCEVDGTLEKSDGAVRFTRFVTRARLEIPEGVSVEVAERLLHKSEKACLIANSVSGEKVLEAALSVAT